MHRSPLMVVFAAELASELCGGGCLTGSDNKVEKYPVLLFQFPESHLRSARRLRRSSRRSWPPAVLFIVIDAL